MSKKPHMHVVQTPDTSSSSDFKELVKTVALTSAVSSLIGVFAVAGGKALLDAIRGARRRKSQPQAQPQPQQVPPAYAPPQDPYPNPSAAPQYDEEDDIPSALRMEPHLRPTGSRRRRVPTPGLTAEQLQQILLQHQARVDAKLDKRFERLEDRMDEFVEEEDEDDEEDAA